MGPIRMRQSEAVAGLSRLYETLATHVPGRLAGLADFALVKYLGRSAGRPFNGQERRIELFLALVGAVNPQLIVESGTYRGATTAFMNESTGLPVWTVEASARYFNYARLRLRSHAAIRVAHGDSRAFLQGLTADPRADTSLPTFFYLDAHWQDDLPLREEIAIVFRHWTQAAIMVDDFRVWDDPGYAYDDYGTDRRISLEYLAPVLPDDVGRFVPSASSDLETGARRGCGIFVTSSLIRTVQGVTLLRPMTA